MRALIAFLFAACLAGAAAGQTPPAFDSSRAWEHLRQMVALGPRPAGSPAIGQARAYIEAQLKTSGIAFAEQAWDDQTPAGPIHMVNVIATISGASPARIVVAGHYDTKRFRQFRFVGANDGGSSTAFVLELARVLKARRNPLTIELLFLDGEEAVDEWRGMDHTYGSRHYVAEARRTGTLASLKAFILVDMIADRDLRIRRDLNSTRWLTDLVWDAARRMNQASVFVSESTEIEDDHLPFVQAGVPSLDIIDLEYPAWHTAQDTLDAVSARSMQTIGEVLIASLPAVEKKVAN
jgi:Zn-dependent M28 family amino/carboxypeptidase